MNAWVNGHILIRILAYLLMDKSVKTHAMVGTAGILGFVAGLMVATKAPQPEPSTWKRGADNTHPAKAKSITPALKETGSDDQNVSEKSLTPEEAQVLLEKRRADNQAKFVSAEGVALGSRYKDIYSNLFTKLTIDSDVRSKMEQQMAAIGVAKAKAQAAIQDLGAARALLDMTLYRAIGTEKYEQEYLPFENAYMAVVEAQKIAKTVQLSESELATVTQLVQKYGAYTKTTYNDLGTAANDLSTPIYGTVKILEGRRKKLQDLENGYQALFNDIAQNESLNPTAASALSAYYQSSIEEMKAGVAEAVAMMGNLTDPAGYMPPEGRLGKR